MIAKLMFVLFAAFTVFLNLSADQGQLVQNYDEAEDFRMAAKSSSQGQKPTVPEKTKRPRSNFKSSLRWKGQICAKKCSFWKGCKTYKCVGHKICCHKGNPKSRCCPTNKPLCIRNKCCPRRYPILCRNGRRCCPANKPLCVRNKCCARNYPILCGNRCCTRGSRCCYGRHCCRSQYSCCGSKCCIRNYRCCGGNCCNRNTKACCDGRRCVNPCPSQMDAVGCYTSLRSIRSADTERRGFTRNLPWRLYRILRPDERNDRIVAKNPRATRTVLSHVNCGSKNNYRSQYISVSASLAVARRYKRKGEQKGLTGLRICQFNTNLMRRYCTIIDLTKEANRNHHLGNAVCKNFARASQELLLKCNQPVPCTIIER